MTLSFNVTEEAVASCEGVELTSLCKDPESIALDILYLSTDKDDKADTIEVTCPESFNKKIKEAHELYSFMLDNVPTLKLIN